MGLDLCVEGKAKPGFEEEWQSIVRRSFAEEPLTDTEIERFNAISLQGYATLGAPQVGKDPAADNWIATKMAGRMSREEAIAKYDGLFALELVESDGLPPYSHAGLYDGVDATSFRGSMLEECTSILGPDVIKAAWEHRMPEAAMAYGQLLLTAASDAVGRDVVEPPQRSIWQKIFGRRESCLPIEEQIAVVESAGRWFQFWGGRGHPIRAYY